MAPKRRTFPRRDLTGRTFGRLTVRAFLNYREDDKGRRHDVWSCVCACGQVNEVRGNSLTTRGVRSCGCLLEEWYAQMGPITRARNSKPPGTAARNTLLDRYMGNAKVKQFEFGLSRDEFFELVAQACHYCGVEPGQRIKRKKMPEDGGFRYNGIDRIDSSIGYHKANCLPCCEICNKAKRDLTYADFKAWLSRVSEFQCKSNS